MAVAVLQVWDYVVIAVVLALSAGVGIFFAFTGGRQRTTSEYMMGDRKLHVLPVSMSMFMSFYSAIFILGRTAEMYKYGVRAYVSTITQVLAYITAGLIIVPLFYKLKITTVFEYLRMRYNSRVLHYTIVFLQLVFQITYMGMTLYAPATALNAVTTLDEWVTIVLVGVVCTFYTTVGGMKAVVWSDTIQGVTYFGGAIFILVMVVIKAGGIGQIFDIAARDGRLNWFNFDPDPTIRLTNWPGFVGGYLLILGEAGCQQAMVQRYCSLPTLKKAIISVLLGIPYVVVLDTISCLIGLGVYAYYAQTQCDPLRSGLVDSSNQLLPHFVVSVLNYPAVPGLFMSILFCGALSSVSSSLNSLASVTWKDIAEPHIKVKMSEWTKTLILKVLVLVYAAIGIGFGFVIAEMPGHISEFRFSKSSIELCLAFVFCLLYLGIRQR